MCNPNSSSTRCLVDKARRIFAINRPSSTNRSSSGLADDLEMVASRRAIPKFEGVESYSRSEQVGAKVKLVDIPRAIEKTHRLELRMFESLQTRCLGHHIVEALAAEASVSSFNRAVVDDLVVCGGPATTVATDLLALRELAWFHFH